MVWVVELNLASGMAILGVHARRMVDLGGNGKYIALLSLFQDASLRARSAAISHIA